MADSDAVAGSTWNNFASAAGKRPVTLSLETAVRFATPGEQAEFAEKLSNAVARLVSEYHDESTDGRWFRLTVGAHPALPISPKEEDG